MDDIDALFTVPLAEFTSARNALAAVLKKSGKTEEANRVKALAKPPISAWVVNQLYWKHRKAFDRLVSTGQDFREAQASRFAGKAIDLHEPAEARRSALTDLSRIAVSILKDAGHNPNLETLRRIATTLEAMSAYAKGPGAPEPGRLSDDVDPPGFDALASLISDVPPVAKPAPVKAAHLSPTKDLTKIAEAKLLLQDAERTLAEARAVLKRAETEANEARKQQHEMEERLEKARAAAEQARSRARELATEIPKLEKAVESAESTVEAKAQTVKSLTNNDI